VYCPSGKLETDFPADKPVMRVGEILTDRKRRFKIENLCGGEGGELWKRRNEDGCF